MAKTIRLAAAFARRSKKLLKQNPQLIEPLKSTITKLSIDPFEPTLHTHPLKGRLAGRYACSLTHELRIIFKPSGDFLQLLDIGTHDEVY